MTLVESDQCSCGWDVNSCPVLGTCSSSTLLRCLCNSYFFWQYNTNYIVSYLVETDLLLHFRFLAVVQIVARLEYSGAHFVFGFQRTAILTKNQITLAVCEENSLFFQLMWVNSPTTSLVTLYVTHKTCTKRSRIR
jgi:hypothetical protein